MGKFPVISISLKGIDAADYETARSGSIATELLAEYQRKRGCQTFHRSVGRWGHQDRDGASDRR